MNQLLLLLTFCVGPIDAVYKVEYDVYSGSCVALNTQHTKPLVLTAAHVVTDIKPSDELIVRVDGKPIRAYIVAKAIKFDMCLLELDTNTPVPSVQVSDTTVNIGDTVRSIGLDATGETINVLRHKVIAKRKVDNVMNIETDGPRILGRSGGGLFNGDAELVGIFVSFMEELGESQNIPIVHVNSLIEDAIAGPFKIKFYSSKTCTLCKQQHAITDNKNDRRIVSDWTEDRIPAHIKLLPHYQFPVATWDTPNNCTGYPKRSGVNSIDAIISMCKISNAIR